MWKKILKIPHGIVEPSCVVNMNLKDVERIAGINLCARRLRERHAHRTAGRQDMDTPCIGSVQVQNERRKETAPAPYPLAAAPDEPQRQSLLGRVNVKEPSGDRGLSIHFIVRLYLIVLSS